MKRLLILALAFVLVGGTSFAAGRYVITSPNQIKPAVLHSIEREASFSTAGSELSGRVLSGPCTGAGALLTGGGFEWHGPGRFELLESHQEGSEWLVEGRVYGHGALRATADCIAPA